MSHPTQRLDNAVHQRIRLGILTVLATTKRVDFTFLRNTLQTTDGNLSRNLTMLEGGGHITTEKTFEKRRPRTWIAITPDGRRALAAEVAALREIFKSVEHTLPAAHPPVAHSPATAWARRLDGAR